jgi:hypothetical protein
MKWVSNIAIVLFFSLYRLLLECQTRDDINNKEKSLFQENGKTSCKWSKIFFRSGWAANTQQINLHCFTVLLVHVITLIKWQWYTCIKQSEVILKISCLIEDCIKIYPSYFPAILITRSLKYVPWYIVAWYKWWVYNIFSKKLSLVGM